MTPLSFEIFDWQGLIPGDEVEVLDDGLVIARGLIEYLSSTPSLIRLKLSYGEGKRIYRREDGWQVRSVCKAARAQPVTGTTPYLQFQDVRLGSNHLLAVAPLRYGQPAPGPLLMESQKAHGPP